MADIGGIAASRFARVRDAFAANFADNAELGARFTVAIDGEPVIDLIGGFADRARTKLVNDRSLAPIFSTGKAIMALMIATLVERGKLDYEQTISSLWPEFGQAGKERITIGEALSHQAGLPGFSPEQDPSIWFDRDAVLRKLAAQAPMWPLGSGSGYHPVTIGYIMGVVFCCVVGCLLGLVLWVVFVVSFGF